MPRYTFVRRSIVEEIFIVAAANEHDALDMVSDGHPKVEVEQGEWVDWAEDNYHLDSVEDEVTMFVKGEAVNG